MPNTTLPPSSSDRWQQPNLIYLDQELNQAWQSDTTYSSRRSAVLAHEQKHIADMKLSYDNNKALLEGYETCYNSNALCEKIAKMVEGWVIQRHKDDGKATQNKWDSL